MNQLQLVSSHSHSHSLISRGHGPRGSAVDSARAGTEDETVVFRAAVQLRSNTVPCLRGTRTFQPTVRIAVLQGWRPSPSLRSVTCTHCVASASSVASHTVRCAPAHSSKPRSLTTRMERWLESQGGLTPSRHGAAVEIEARGSPALAFAATTCCM